MKWWKQITALALLLAWLLPLVYGGLLQLKQYYVQWQMLEALEHELLVTITADITAIAWIDAGKECWVQGSLFDVKHFKQEGNKLVLTGLFDEQEQQIKKQLLAQTKRQQQHNHHQQKWNKMLQLLSAVAVSASVELGMPSRCIQSLTYYHISYYNTPFQAIPSPPPRQDISFSV